VDEVVCGLGIRPAFITAGDVAANDVRESSARSDRLLSGEALEQIIHASLKKEHADAQWHT